MTREELAQVVRDQISRAVSNALTSGVPSVGILRRCEEEILRAADKHTQHRQETQ